MDQDSRRLYKALTSRDSRFDGVFFVGVTSTDIYCRPICPVKTPKEANCRFFDTPQEAEHAGFRPCLRCRPELAPGSAPVDDAQRIAQLIVQRLEEGHFDEKAGLEEIADQFELSSRQIRRIIHKELGVPPTQLLLTRRLLLAKQLLTETTLPITEVAFASGFSSLRRFNDAFNRRYGMPPTRLRKKATEDAAAITESQTSTLQLSYRPPYDWKGVFAFLAARALKGIEHVTDGSYARTVQLGDRLTPAPVRIAAASVDDIARHGIVAARAKSIIALAGAQGSGALSLDGGAHHNPDDAIKRLTELPGIGQWTAHYIAMRALHWPDAFPKEDIAVRNNLGGVTAKEAEVLSQAWRPWRSYAVMHVWGMPKQLQ